MHRIFQTRGLRRCPADRERRGIGLDSVGRPNRCAVHEHLRLILAAKIALVGVLLAFAWINKVVLTPALQQSRTAPARLRRSIAVEIALFAIILAARGRRSRPVAPPGME